MSESMVEPKKNKNTKFLENVTNVIKDLRNKIETSKKTPLCDNCGAFLKNGQQTIAQMRELLRDKKNKPCLCKNHIQEYLKELLQEKNEKKKGGTSTRRRITRIGRINNIRKKTPKNRKGGTGQSLLSNEEIETNRLIEDIYRIDIENIDFATNKQTLIDISRRLNQMISNQYELDLHYTGEYSDIIPIQERPFHAIVLSYFSQIKNNLIPNTKSIHIFHQTYINIFANFIIGFINNPQKDPLVYTSYSYSRIILFLCKEPDIKDEIINRIRDMATNTTRFSDNINKIASNILQNPIFHQLCDPMVETTAKMIDVSVHDRNSSIYKKQMKRLKQNKRRIDNYNKSRKARRNSIHNHNSTFSTTRNPLMLAYSLPSPKQARTDIDAEGYPITDNTGIWVYPEGTVDNNNITIPFSNNDEPDTQQIEEQQLRRLRAKARSLRRSSI